MPAGGLLSVRLAAEPRGAPSHPVKEEPAEPEGPASSHTDIQLLPQQAGMASILATAVINSEYTCPCHRSSMAVPRRGAAVALRSSRSILTHGRPCCTVLGMKPPKAGGTKAMETEAPPRAYTA